MTNNTSTIFLDYPFIDFSLVYAKDRVANVAMGAGLLDTPLCLPGYLGNCNGTLVKKQCSMRPATLDYPTVMVNNNISILKNSSKFPVDHVQAVGNSSSDFYDYHDPQPMPYITLGRVAKAAQNLFTSQHPSPYPTSESMALLQVNT